jgi:hypothetical protein
MNDGNNAKPNELEPRNPANKAPRYPNPDKFSIKIANKSMVLHY